jgi:hypothetical protein
VSLPFLGTITAANETSLIEEDRPEPLAVSDGARVAFTIRPFGVKTMRVKKAPTSSLPAIPAVLAEPVSDMEIQLSWQAEVLASQKISHYHVYRGTTADFQPTLLNLVQRPTSSCIDRPQLHYGGWINNRIEPNTTYYYRVSAVDHWNNEGPVSPAASVKTKNSSEKNMLPLQVECLRAVVVSPIAPFNCINLLWRTNCESDIRSYEVHRSTVAGFEPSAATRIAAVDAQSVLKGGIEYGQTPIEYRLGDFDHQMYLDTAVEPATSYFYRVCAIDAVAQKGPFSQEVPVTTKTVAK